LQEWAAGAAAGGLPGDVTAVLRRTKVLITGSGGYLGRALYLAVLRAGGGARGLDARPGETVDDRADVASPDVVRTSLERGGCGIVLHCAALRPPRGAGARAADSRGGSRGAVVDGAAAVRASSWRRRRRSR
jgi:hypothetical protein